MGHVTDIKAINTHLIRRISPVRSRHRMLKQNQNQLSFLNQICLPRRIPDRQQWPRSSRWTPCCVRYCWVCSVCKLMEYIVVSCTSNLCLCAWLVKWQSASTSVLCSIIIIIIIILSQKRCICVFSVYSCLSCVRCTSWTEFFKKKQFIIHYPPETILCMAVLACGIIVRVTGKGRWSN